MPKSPPPEKKPRKNYLTFSKDFEPPETEIGDTFEAVAEIRRDKDGYCVVSLDGVPLKDEKEPEDEEEESETIGAGAKQAMEGYV